MRGLEDDDDDVMDRKFSRGGGGGGSSRLSTKKKHPSLYDNPGSESRSNSTLTFGKNNNAPKPNQNNNSSYETSYYEEERKNSPPKTRTTTTTTTSNNNNRLNTKSYSSASSWNPKAEDPDDDEAEDDSFHLGNVGGNRGGSASGGVVVSSVRRKPQGSTSLFKKSTPGVVSSSHSMGTSTTKTTLSNNPNKKKNPFDSDEEEEEQEDQVNEHNNVRTTNNATNSTTSRWNTKSQKDPTPSFSNANTNNKNNNNSQAKKSNPFEDDEEEDYSGQTNAKNVYSVRTDVVAPKDDRNRKVVNHNKNMGANQKSSWHEQEDDYNEEEEEEEDYYSKRPSQPTNTKKNDRSNINSRSNSSSVRNQNAKTLRNPFDDDEDEDHNEEEDYNKQVSSNKSNQISNRKNDKGASAYDNRSSEAVKDKKIAPKTDPKVNKNPFGDDSNSDDDYKNEILAVVAASNKTTKRTNFAGANSYDKPSSYSAKDTLDNKSVPKPATKKTSSNPFGDDSDQSDDNNDYKDKASTTKVAPSKTSLWEKPSAYEKHESYTTSNTATNRNMNLSTAVSARTKTPQKASSHPYHDDSASDENSDDYPNKMSTVTATRTKTALRPNSAGSTSYDHRNSYPSNDSSNQTKFSTPISSSAKSKINTKAAVNPFDNDSDDNSMKVIPLTVTDSAITVKRNNQKNRNPFGDDSASDEEHNTTQRTTHQVQGKFNQTRKNKWYDDEEEEEDERVTTDTYNAVSPQVVENKSKPIRNKNMNPFDDDEEDDVENNARDTMTEKESSQLDDPSSSGSNNCCLGCLAALCPRLAPLPLGAFCFLFAMLCIPACGYIAAFTKMGYGIKVFYFFSNLFQEESYIFGFALLGYIFLLYIFDIDFWTSKIGKWTRTFALSILLCAFGTFLLFVSGDTPYGPIALFTVIVPVWMIIIRGIFFRKTPTRIYVSWLGLPMFFVSIFVAGAWILWTFQDDENKWSLYARLVDAQASGCLPDYTTYDACHQVNTTEPCFLIDYDIGSVTFPDGCPHSCSEIYHTCSNTFIIWVGPLLVTISLIFLSFFSTFLRTETTEKDVANFAKIWIFLLFALWVSASLAGIAQGITTTLAALTLASFVASAIFLLHSFNKDEREARMNLLMTQISDKYGGWFDVFRGLLIVATAPIAICIFILSSLVQFIRYVNPFTCFCKPTRQAKNRHDEDHVIRCITTQADRQVRAFLSWDRCKVYKYAIYWGIAFVTLNVLIAKFTILFLSWLIVAVKSMHLAAVTFIMIGAGIIMFLLPPVPGVPIYLALGIIIPANGMKLIPSVFYATAISLVIKLVSVVIQQKAFGGWLRKYVSVRKFCAINSTLTRSITLILSDKHLSMAKVCILVGGPDWPTSTMCGIINLNILPVQIGTLPVITLIVPTVLTGTFTYMMSIKPDGEPKYPSATTLTAIMAVLTAIVQFGAMIIAAGYLDRAIKHRADEIAAIPIDEEVKVAEDIASEYEDAYKEVTKWSDVPWYMKFFLTLSLILMIASCYIVQLFQSRCFAPFSLSSTIEKDLDGNWINLVKPLGAFVFLLFLSSLLFFYIFSSWASSKTRKVVKKAKIPVTIPNAFEGSDQ